MELSAQEMNTILPYCFSEISAEEITDLAVYAKKYAKTLSREQKLGIGAAIDKGFADHKERKGEDLLFMCSMAFLIMR